MDNIPAPARVTLLKMGEVAEVLGCSKTQAYRLAKNGMLPSVRFGSLVRIRPEDLEKFLLDHRSEAPMVAN